MEKAHAGLATHGMAWFAHDQNAGKGQRGKSWFSEPGKNIALSLVLQPELMDNPHQFYLSAAMALACFEFFCSYAGEETKIKWPNDLYWRDRKAGGILIENIFQGNKWKFGVVGIGININQLNFGLDLNNPVSLKQITGKNFDPLVLAKELYGLLVKKSAELNASSFNDILAAYNQNLYRQNEKVMLKKGNMVFESVVKGITPLGQLHTIDTTERYFDFGEVEWLG